MARRSRHAVRSDREVLEAFLVAPSRPAGTLPYHQLQGFLFTVTTSPELILPSEWLPIVFGGQEAGYRSLAEAQAVVGDNLEPDAPISQWSQGFTLGHEWLRETRDQYLPDADEDDDFGAIVLVLSFFAARRLAEAYRRELKLRGTLAATATSVRGLFPESLRHYARLGRMIAAVGAEHEAPRTRRTRTSRTTRKARRR